jgi:hypothetical protein
MISKNTFLLSPKSYLFFFMLLVLPSTLCLFAQSFTPQKLDFTKICAYESFNEFHANFGYAGFPAGTTFVVELSDPAGSWSTPTPTIALPPIVDTATDKTLAFAVPVTLIGSDTYNLRIKATTGAGVITYSANFKSNDLKSPFPSYFKDYNTSFYINNKNGSISFCSGGSITLTIDNPTPDSPGSSPANFPQLKYIWYKDNLQIPGETSSSLSVSTDGSYYVKINYGACTDENIRSQDVAVVGKVGGVASITSSAGNPFCASSGNTTLTAVSGNGYVWKKDGDVISGEIAQTYQTSLPGTYTCDIDFGGCSSTGSIGLKVNEISSTISGVDVDQINYIQEGETVNVATTTSATAPSYQWFLSDVAISGATQSTLVIPAAGKYELIITETTGCVVTSEFLFEVAYKVRYDVGPKIANIITPDHTWIIPEEYLNGKAIVMILNYLGEIVYKADNYDNFNGWPETPIDFKSFNPVYYYIITPSGQSAKKGSITVFK